MDHVPDCSPTTDRLTYELGTQHESALYYLNITQDKLTSEGMKKLKCILCYLVREKIVTKNLTIEVHITQSTSTELVQTPSAEERIRRDDSQFIKKLLFNGYNLLEPEHSKEFPLLNLVILLPDVFGSPPALTTDPDISLLIHNETSEDMDLALSKRLELTDFKQPYVLQINEILEASMAKSTDLKMLVRANFFEEPLEKESSGDLKLFAFDKGGIAMGGTFDHLHNGHKLLLSQAMLCSNSRILCGVTTDALLKKKVYAQYLESFDARRHSVIDFCTKVNPRITSMPEGKGLVTFELDDPIGPTGTDSELEALVLTREVAKGGVMINEARERNGLHPLRLVFVDMILSEVTEDDTSFSNKTSSTYIREYIAKKADKHSE